MASLSAPHTRSAHKRGHNDPEVSPTLTVGSRWRCHQRDHRGWLVAVNFVSANFVGFVIERASSGLRGQKRKIDREKFRKDFAAA